MEFSVLKRIITKNMSKVLDERNYEYSDDALCKIVDAWYSSKKSLIDLLSKHPNWDEENLFVKLASSYTREFDGNGYNNFLSWMQNRFLFRSEEWMKSYDIIKYISSMDTPIFDESKSEIVNELNELNAEYKIRVGMKLTKVIGKIFRTEGWDSHPDYNRKYAALCDSISPVIVNKTTVLSLNPVDYLLMSNGNSWESCHYIGNEYTESGCYSAGTISYMLDKSSMIFYTLDAYYGEDDSMNDRIPCEPKIERQVFGYNHGLLLQSRLYPQSCDSGCVDLYKNYRNIVQSIVSDCEGVANLWKKCEDLHVKSEDGCAYEDWQYYNTCNTTFNKDIHSVESYSMGDISINETPICIKCGNHHSHEENILCSDCYDDGRVYCEYIDEYADEDDCVLIGDYWYLEEDCERCHDCGEWILTSGRRYWNADDFQRVNGHVVCRSCYDENYGICQFCEEDCSNDDLTYVPSEDGCVCDDCLSEYFTLCKNCDEYFRTDDMVEGDDGFCYCELCDEELKELENKKEEKNNDLEDVKIG